MENIVSILAQEVAPQAQGGGYQMLIFIVLMFAAMYFLMIAPQRKRQKQHQQMIKELKSGDKVVSIGGIIGTITNVKEKTFIVKLCDNTKVEFLKSAISDKIADETEAEQTK
ncbi:MAG: preprotein translocase subunit YajC [Verrucomicrobiaceae bacterium]|jgi:preprotein translocase subunit YajC|nr:preprotein translocase subunit YajC [Verrucomicrobiaceae bacterium]